MNTKFENYSIQISTPDQFTPPEDRLRKSDHTWHGAAIMWHESLNSNVQNICNTHERFTGIKLNFQGQHFLAIAAYLPTSGKDDEFLDCLDQLTDFIQQNSSDGSTILIGTDSNCSPKSTPRRLSGFQQFCQDHELTKVCLSVPTFHHSNGMSSSNIDYFLLSHKYSQTPKLSKTFSQCTQDFPENFSSHDPVFATLQIPGVTHSTALEKCSHTYSDFTQTK